MKRLVLALFVFAVTGIALAAASGIDVPTAIVAFAFVTVASVCAGVVLAAMSERWGVDDGYAD